MEVARDTNVGCWFDLHNAGFAVSANNGWAPSVPNNIHLQMNTIKHSAKSYTTLVLAIHIHIHMVNLNIHTQCQIWSTRAKKERHCVCVCMWAWLCSLYMTAACRTDLVWQITLIGCWFTDGVPLCECAVFVIWRLIHSLCACILAYWICVYCVICWWKPCFIIFCYSHLSTLWLGCV